MHLFLFFLIVIFKWESEDVCGSLFVSKLPPPHTLPACLCEIYFGPGSFFLQSWMTEFSFFNNTNINSFMPP